MVKDSLGENSVKNDSTENSSSERHSLANTTTIVDGIAFVDPERLEEDKRLIAERENNKRKVKEELLLEKRLEKEKYEKEIQEKQYKRLMHLLGQSKALSNFLFKKVEDNKKAEPKKTKSEIKNLKRAAVENKDEPPSKRSRKPNQKYLDDNIVSKVMNTLITFKLYIPLSFFCLNFSLHI